MTKIRTNSGLHLLAKKALTMGEEDWVVNREHMAPGLSTQAQRVRQTVHTSFPAGMEQAVTTQQEHYSSPFLIFAGIIMFTEKMYQSKFSYHLKGNQVSDY